MPTTQTLLDDRDTAMLAFEGQWWKFAGAKEAAIRTRFDMTATRYYARLNWIIDQQAALAHDPLLVRRLRRLRDSRRQARSTAPASEVR